MSHLFRYLGDERDGQPHPLGPADPPDPVDVVWLFVRQSHIDDERHTLDIKTPGGHVGTDQELDLFVLKNELKN